METHEGKNKDPRKTEFKNSKAKQCLLRPHPLKFLPHNSAKGGKLSWYGTLLHSNNKKEKQILKPTGQMAKEAFEALRSSCKLKTDFDKLQAIENGSKEDLRLLPITVSLIAINFCRVLTRRKKKTLQLLYWRWEVQPVLIHFICDTECRRCSERRGTVAT